MAVIAKWYGLAQSGQYGSTPVNWTGDTIKVGLCTSSYSPNQDTDQFWSTPQANEVSGAGYAAGGVTLSGKSVTFNTGTNVAALVAGNAQWTNGTFTTRYAVVYKSTGTASTSPLLGYVDFGADESVVSGTFTLAWDATLGVLYVTVS